MNANTCARVCVSVKERERGVYCKDECVCVIEGGRGEAEFRGKVKVHVFISSCSSASLSFFRCLYVCLCVFVCARLFSHIQITPKNICRRFLSFSTLSLFSLAPHLPVGFDRYSVLDTFLENRTATL